MHHVHPMGCLTQREPWQTRTPKRVSSQTVKTQMKCSIMLHFIRVCTVCSDKINLQRKNLEIQCFLEINTCDPSIIYTMDHPDLNVSNIMGNSIGTKRVKLYEHQISSQSSGAISSVIWIHKCGS